MNICVRDISENLLGSTENRTKPTPSTRVKTRQMYEMNANVSSSSSSYGLKYDTRPRNMMHTKIAVKICTELLGLTKTTAR
jgi:hypothetical protein